MQLTLITQESYSSFWSILLFDFMQDYPDEDGLLLLQWELKSQEHLQRHLILGVSKKI